MRGNLKRSGGGEELAGMGVQAWKIMVLAHREENDLQKPQTLPNTTREICVSAYQLLSWERSESQLLAQIFVLATKNDVEAKECISHDGTRHGVYRKTYWIFKN